MSRIQKLLFSEFSSFDERVLVESPFAETSRNGVGRQQVHMAITLNNMIIASDVPKQVAEYSVFFKNGLDPEIETMELVSIFPMDFVNLSVFQKRRKQVLKLRLHDGSPSTAPRIRYLELGGGLTDRNMTWMLWCERIGFLAHTGSCTEESVASSTSALASCRVSRKRSGNRIWEHYDRATTLLSNPSEIQTIYVRQRSKDTASACNMAPPVRVNRFGEGVSERCNIGLYLKPSDGQDLPNDDTTNAQEKVEKDSVDLWRLPARPSGRKRFLPCPELNNMAGIYGTDLAGKCTFQLKRSRSQVRVLRVQPSTLACSQSVEKYVVLQDGHKPDDLNFWTPRSWYKPPGFTRSKPTPARNVPSRVRMFFSRSHGKRSSESKGKLQKSLSVGVSMWELDSAVLATQLTIIDTKLFLRIKSKELILMKKEGHARNCRNFFQWITFSQRTTCLTVTQILHMASSKRARMIARCIMVCDSCHRLGNQQSTLSILNALRSPPLFRLSETWNRVRRHHARAYQVFKSLLKQYRFTDVPDVTQPPFLTCAKFYLDSILGRWCIPDVMPEIGSSESLLDAEEVRATKLSTLANFKENMMSILQSVSKTSGSDADTQLNPASVDASSTSDMISCSSVNFQSALAVFQATRKAATAYDFCSDSRANEFLLHAKFQDQHISFMHSLKIEPR